MVKLREKIEGRARPGQAEDGAEAPNGSAGAHAQSDDEDSLWERSVPARPVSDDALLVAKTHLADALEELSDVLQAQAAMAGASSSERQNLAKYLTIAKLKLENAIAVIRSTEPRN